jgi:hypothetical protein
MQTNACEFSMCRSRILAGVSGARTERAAGCPIGKILEVELRRFGGAKLWGEYLIVFEDATSATSTEEAPWYAVPANRSGIAVSSWQSVSSSLKDMKLKAPPAPEGVDFTELGTV